MKLKNLLIQNLFFKIKISKNAFLKLFPKKLFTSFFIKKLKSIFPEIHLHFLTLLGQFLFLAIILLFLFLLSVYFSQIDFIKKHSNHYKQKNLDLLFLDKINRFDMRHSKPPCQTLKLASNIRIDYG